MASQTTNGESRPEPIAEEISLIELVTAILRNWRVLLLLPVLFGLFAGVRALTQGRSYAASSSFMPQAADTRNASGAAALAQQFGISLGSDRPGHSPEFYVDLLESGTLLRRAVESTYTLPSVTGRSTTGTLVQYWKLDAPDAPAPAWRSAVQRLRSAVSGSVVRETGVVEVTVSADHPRLAEQINQRLLDLLNEYNLEMRQSRAREEARFISGRLTEAQEELLTAESALETFLRRNRNFRNSPELTFEHDRLQRQVAMRQEVYASLLRAQEQARIDGVRDTPLLTVIDSPAGNGVPASKRVLLRAVIGFMLGLLLAVSFASMKEAGRRGRKTNNPHYRELEDVVRRIMNDLRHPRRWIRNGEQRVATDKK